MSHRVTESGRSRPACRVACLEQFSGKNLGDCLALEQTMRDIESVAPSASFDVYSVAGLDPVKYYSAHSVRRVMMMPWNLSANFLGLPALVNLPRADCVLVRGGTIFDMWLWNPAFSYLLNLFFVLRYARWVGRKIIMYGVGIGPLRTKLSRAMARSACNCADVITTRDQDSLDLLRKIGVDRPRLALAADPAIRLSRGGAGVPQSMMDEFGISPETQILGLSPTGSLSSCDKQGGRIDKGALAKGIAETVGRLAQERGCRVLVLPTSDRDMAYSQEIAALVPGARVVDKRRWQWPELMALTSSMRLLVGMRMHSLVLAVASGSAALGVIYHPKVASFMTELGCPGLAISPARLVSGEGARLLTETWDNASEVARLQAEGREKLARRAEVSTKMFKEMMGVA